MERITNFNTTQIRLTTGQFAAMPVELQKLIRVHGREYPQGFGKPSIIELPDYMMDEIRACVEKHYDVQK